VEAINAGAVPTIRSAWESVSELECKRAVELAMESFMNFIAENTRNLPLDQEDVHKVYLDGKMKAVEEFNLRALGEVHQVQPFREKLEQLLNDEYTKLCAKNDAASDKSCRDLLNNLYQAVDRALQRDEFTSCADLSQHWKKIVDAEYIKRAKGNAKFRVLSEFALEKVGDTMIVLDQNLQEKLRRAHAAEVATLREEMKEEREEKRKQREEFNAMRQELTNQLEKTNHHIETLEGQLGMSNEHIDTLKTANGEAREEIVGLKTDQDQLRKERDRLNQELEKVNQQLKDLAKKEEKKDQVEFIVPAQAQPKSSKKKKASKCIIS
jgi:chromosome segregation ATPase